MYLSAHYISWYQLTLEPNTYFAQFPPALPQDETLWAIQEAGEKLLAKAGYQHYEISAVANGVVFHAITLTIGNLAIISASARERTAKSR